MNLERSLVLNRYLHSLFGAERFDELRRALKEQEEGTGPDGRSRFFHVLAGRSGLNPSSCPQKNKYVISAS